MVRERILDVCKYSLLLIVLLYLIFIVIPTGGSARAFVEVSEPIAIRVREEGLESVSPQGFQQAYGIHQDDLKGVMMYVNSFRFSVEEVLLIQVSSLEQVDEVRDMIEQRIAKRLQEFGNHLPEQAAFLEEARIVVRGTYIFLAVGSSAEELITIFLDSL